MAANGSGRIADFSIPLQVSVGVREPALSAPLCGLEQMFREGGCLVHEPSRSKGYERRQNRPGG